MSILQWDFEEGPALGERHPRKLAAARGLVHLDQAPVHRRDAQPRDVIVVEDDLELALVIAYQRTLSLDHSFWGRKLSLDLAMIQQDFSSGDVPLAVTAGNLPMMPVM